MARDAGFDLVSFGPADLGPHAEHLARWLDAGRAGEMDYLHRNREVLLDPSRFLPGARSTVALGYDYGGREAKLAGGAGRIASYATGRDYHRFLGKATRRLRAAIEAEGLATAGSIRVGTDAVPVLERALAARAGIGFLAKSAGVISPTHGPYLLLSELVTQLDLEPDPPSLGSCGSCTACLDACPTAAIVAPHEVDARRCLSYTTIELRGFIPRALRAAQADRLFGCDVCLAVCPFTSKGRSGTPDAEPRPEMATHRALETYDLVGVLSLSAEEYDTDWTGTAMRRATRSGLRRNAAVVLGNLGDPAAIPSLCLAMDDADPVVRGHAAWALARLGIARGKLEGWLAREADVQVRTELEAALEAT